MTKIGVITLEVPVDYRFGNQTVTMSGVIETDCSSPEELHSLRELFAYSLSGSVIFDPPWGKPIGDDMDAEQRNTQYIQFTHGDKSITGWYLLQTFTMFQDETALGFAYNFSITLFLLGTKSYYQPGFIVDDMDDVGDEIDDNDWDI